MEVLSNLLWTGNNITYFKELFYGVRCYIKVVTYDQHIVCAHWYSNNIAGVVVVALHWKFNIIICTAGSLYRFTVAEASSAYPNLAPVSSVLLE